MLVHEQRVNRTTSEEHALKISTNDEFSTWRGSSRGRGRGRSNRDGSRFTNYKSENHHTYDPRWKVKGRDNQQSTDYESKWDKSNIECFRCHKFGHYRSECRTNLQKENGDQSNFAENKEEEEEEEEATILMACHTIEENHQNLWYIDTGCSNHMCGSKSIFSKLDESFQTTVRFGDNSKFSIMGKGDIQI